MEWKGRELRRGSEKGDRIRETECGKTEGKGNKGHMQRRTVGFVWEINGYEEKKGNEG